jgi:glycosyltransferase involved in cell wall biosynthesis
VLEAFRTVAGALPAARLVVAGDGPDRARLEAGVRKLDLGDRVELLGRVRHEDVPGLLARSTVLCCPSVGEPFGMVVLEAMAAARPVVAVRDGGPSWLVDPGRGGILTTGDGADELAFALLEVVRNRAKATRMGSHNRSRVEAELTLDRLVDDLEHLYASGAEAAA